MKNLLINFTNTYPKEKDDTYKLSRLDFSSMSGTDMYCDDEALTTIRDSLMPFGPEGIHFIDSGNYHYMSYIFTSMIEKPYILVIFDHHTDMKPAMFDMLSCGAWIKTVLDNDTNIKKAVLIGPPEKSIDEIPDGDRSDPRLICVSEEEYLSAGIPSDVIREINSLSLPVYLSIDKDILKTSDAVTNWDQGNVSLDILLDSVHKIPNIMGADICGLLPEKDGADPTAYEKNSRSDSALYQAILTAVS